MVMQSMGGILRIAGLNLDRCTMQEVYDKFGLEATTKDFIGHSMALYTNDGYIKTSGMAKDTVQRIRLYVNSMARYGKSPYIYPLYGLGELPQGFARLSAIYGGTYMLNTNIDEVLYDGGKVSGIKATMKERGEEGDGMKFETKTKKILADPSYFPGKVHVVGHLIKAICILNHPVANTDSSDSCQLIIPQSQVGRKNGMITQICDETRLILTRHLPRGCVLCSQRLPQGILHCHRLHHCGKLSQPSPRATSRFRAFGQD